MIMIKLTKRHRANLRKHDKFLRNQAVQSKFDMQYLAVDYRGDKIEDVSDVCVCGTVMCSLGYAALCFPRIARQHDNWDEFCQDIFGMEPYKGWLVWDFLFNGKWTRIDNTITGAADRIDYFLKHGVPVDRWNPEVYRSAS